MNIKIKELVDGCMPVETKNGDWIDLKAACDVIMFEGEYHEIPLGIAMQLPEGFEAHIAPRSSTFKRYGILCANSFGVIDNSFCGDGDQWCFPSYATRRTEIPKGSRICQFRVIENQPEILFDRVETLGNVDRGGLGSTGY